MDLEIRDLVEGDREKLLAINGGNGWNADAAVWAGYLADHKAGRRAVAIAWNNGVPVGYGNLVWEPPYAAFREAGIPEINNLAVDVKARRQGVATAMIRHLEGLARRAGRIEIGLGVGLYADYGAAQRLYFRLGYRPDGRGITYADQPLAPMATITLDDDLVLWLSKPIS